MKKMITVPVGAKVTITKGLYNKSEFISYGYTDSIYIEDTLDNLIKTLTDFQNEYKDQYTNLRIREQKCTSCYHSCDCSPTFKLFGSRLENDLEYNFRIKKEADEKMAKEQIERKQYEELKAKFESR